jgi:transposase
MKQFIRIGVDLAKNYFQVHALASEGGPAVTRKLKRAKMLEFFSQIEPCRVGMEACGSAHYWARELKALGHEALLMPALSVIRSRLPASRACRLLGLDPKIGIRHPE